MTELGIVALVAAVIVCVGWTERRLIKAIGKLQDDLDRQQRDFQGRLNGLARGIDVAIDLLRELDRDIPRNPCRFPSLQSFDDD